MKSNPIESDKPLRVVAIFTAGVIAIAGCAHATNATLQKEYQDEAVQQATYSAPRAHAQAFYPEQQATVDQFFQQ